MKTRYLQYTLYQSHLIFTDFVHLQSYDGLLDEQSTDQTLIQLVTCHQLFQ